MAGGPTTEGAVDGRADLLGVDDVERRDPAPVAGVRTEVVERLGSTHGRGDAVAAAQRLLGEGPAEAAAVSRQIAALERAVGAPLFARAPRGVRLTEAGALLVAHATAALAELDAAQAAITRLRERRGRPAGRGGDPHRRHGARPARGGAAGGRPSRGGRSPGADASTCASCRRALAPGAPPAAAAMVRALRAEAARFAMTRAPGERPPASG